MLGKVSEKNGFYPSSLGLFLVKKSLQKNMDSEGFGAKVFFWRDEEDDLVHSSRSRKQAHLSKALTNVEYIVPI